MFRSGSVLVNLQILHWHHRLRQLGGAHERASHSVRIARNGRDLCILRFQAATSYATCFAVFVGGSAHPRMRRNVLACVPRWFDERWYGVGGLVGRCRRYRRTVSTQCCQCAQARARSGLHSASSLPRYCRDDECVG